MSRYVTPLILVTASFTGIAVFIFLTVAPGSSLIIATFLAVVGIALAGVLTLGLYFLRRFAGPKDSPRFLLRDSMRQGVIGSLGVILFLLLQIFGAINPVTLVIVVVLTLAFERLT